MLANLLAPAGGTVLSTRVSQQEYARLFERDRAGFGSATAYSSDGSWAQSGSQFGAAGSVSYSVDAAWRFRAGWRPNHDLAQFLGSGECKVQLTPQDSAYVLGAYSDLESGDVRPFYDDAPRHDSP